MPRTPRDIPPPLELACLRALWDLEQGNVHAVREIVGRSRPLAYTTIMTVLDRLVRKGKLTRQKQGRSYTYSPSQSRDALRRAAVRELIDGYFGGSEAELVAFLRNGDRNDRTPAAQHVPSDGRIDAALL
jgi:predicted transcriptional regulator